MSDFHKLVPLPALTDINTGLSACRPETMLSLFGKPGRFTRDCAPVTEPKLLKQIVTKRAGMFIVTGWWPAVGSLQRVMLAVQAEKPELYKLVRTAGMLCCRAVRGSDTDFSIHSWGAAIDLEIESQIDTLGANQCQQGILELYPYFHREGWFWAAGYHGRKDPMHFEGSDETVRRWYAQENP